MVQFHRVGIFLALMLMVGTLFADNSTITISKNETISYVYAPATAPLGDFTNIFGTLIILIGIYQTIKYATTSFNGGK